MKTNEDWVNNEESPDDLTLFLMYTHDWLMGCRIHCRAQHKQFLIHFMDESSQCWHFFQKVVFLLWKNLNVKKFSPFQILWNIVSEYVPIEHRYHRNMVLRAASFYQHCYRCAAPWWRICKTLGQALLCTVRKHVCKHVINAGRIVHSQELDNVKMYTTYKICLIDV